MLRAVEELLGPKDIAQILGISERGATRLLASGEIAALRVGKLWRATDLDFEAYIVRRRLEQRRKREAEKNLIKRVA